MLGSTPFAAAPFAALSDGASVTVLSGVATTGAVGSVGIVEFSHVLDGQVAYGQVGILGVIHTVALIEGWGAYGWGVEPWGGSPGASQIDTAVGNVVGGQLLGPGVSATGGVGTVTPGVIPFPEGDVAYGFVGTVGNIHEVALDTNDVLGWGEGPWSGDTSTGGFYDMSGAGSTSTTHLLAMVRPAPLRLRLRSRWLGLRQLAKLGHRTIPTTYRLRVLRARGRSGRLQPILLSALLACLPQALSARWVLSTSTP